MAGFVRYEIENEASLKAHSQDVADKVAFELGFETKRKQLDIKIRFKKGASHANWINSKHSPDADVLIGYLVNGYKCGGRAKGASVKPRPVFDNYADKYSEDMKEIVVQTFRTYSHWSVPDRCVVAGRKIMEDFKKKIYSGSLGLVKNEGKYLELKLKYGKGDIPLVATKKLFDALEVVIE